MVSVLSFLLSAIYVIACLFLIFVVLIQKGEGGGLGGLAGGGAVDVAFGAKADMTWKRATAVAAGIFVVLALLLGFMPPYKGSRSIVGTYQQQQTPPAPPAPTPPGAGTGTGNVGSQAPAGLGAPEKPEPPKK